MYLGRDSQEGSNPNEVTRTVSEMKCHPNYEVAATFDSDICLLKLSSPVTFNDYVTPVCLAASQAKFLNGTDSWVTGWGDISSGGKLKRSRTVALNQSRGVIWGTRRCLKENDIQCCWPTHLST